MLTLTSNQRTLYAHSRGPFRGCSHPMGVHPESLTGSMAGRYGLASVPSAANGTQGPPRCFPDPSPTSPSALPFPQTRADRQRKTAASLPARSATPPPAQGVGHRTTDLNPNSGARDGRTPAVLETTPHRLGPRVPRSRGDTELERCRVHRTTGDAEGERGIQGGNPGNPHPQVEKATAPPPARPT